MTPWEIAQAEREAERDARRDEAARAAGYAGDAEMREAMRAAMASGADPRTAAGQQRLRRLQQRLRRLPRAQLLRRRPLAPTGPGVAAP